MGDHDRKQDHVPDFETVLWGYDRGQVERCLADMTTRLEDALSKLDAVEVLQAQLCEAKLEIDQLRRAAEERPSMANRISRLMMAAEELHQRARREAEVAGGGAADPVGAAASGQ